MLITKEFTFDAAHKLLKYNGPCGRLHGHTYRLQITISGTVQKNGMVMDFLDLKRTVKEKVLARLDHAYLNEVVDQPTAENLAVWIWDQLGKDLPLYEIKVWETPTGSATYRGRENEG